MLVLFTPTQTTQGKYNYKKCSILLSKLKVNK